MYTCIAKYSLVFAMANRCVHVCTQTPEWSSNFVPGQVGFCVLLPNVSYYNYATGKQ